MAVLANITSIKIRGTYVPDGTGFLDEVKLGSAARGQATGQATWIERSVIVMFDFVLCINRRKTLFLINCIYLLTDVLVLLDTRETSAKCVYLDITTKTMKVLLIGAYLAVAINTQTFVTLNLVCKYIVEYCCERQLI